MVDLGKWLLKVSSQPRTDGVWDCGKFPAAWVLENGYDDPSARWHWNTELEAEQIIFEAGGIVPLFDDGLTGVGVAHRAGDPVAGDIGIVSLRGESAGAIFTGQKWAFVTPKGILFVTLPPESIEAVWAVSRG